VAAERTVMALDEGVAVYVERLQAAGIETFESCEGGPGHSYSEPVVRFFGDHGEGFRALAVVLASGFPVSDLRRFWQIVNGEPCGPYWELSFYGATGARSACTRDSHRSQNGGS
jgi:hypothetical protein